MLGLTVTSKQLCLLALLFEGASLLVDAAKPYGSEKKRFLQKNVAAEAEAAGAEIWECLDLLLILGDTYQYLSFYQSTRHPTLHPTRGHPTLHPTRHTLHDTLPDTLHDTLLHDTL